MSERIKITVIEEIDKERADGKESGWEETDRKETVTKENHRKETVLLHDVGKTLLYTLREGGIKLPSLCGSIGKCGRCQVKFRGQAPLPSQADRALIAPDKLREGYRLACMARPRKNCTVETAFAQEAEIHVVVGSSERNLWKRDRCGNPCEKKDAAGMDIAVAVDIGTTTIAMQLIQMESGHVLDTYTCMNPQRSYGEDVVSRIRAGAGGEGERLQHLVREALATGLGRMLERNGQNRNDREEKAEDGNPGKPKLMVISANTVMGHLFMGYPVESLGRSPFLPVNTKTVSLNFLGIPTVLIPGISAFVGGDIVSGLYACGLYPAMAATGMPMEKAWLFLDLGTNAEMVIGKGNRIACTAAAAGPAFEGRGKQGKAGSKQIEAIAFLLEKGIADREGLLKEPYFETGIEVELDDKKEKIQIFQQDIRDIQMAKAAVRAGIYFLMKKLGIKDDEIERVYVAGGFGFYLKKKAAVEIGLIPAGLGEKMETVGNTSLAGAKMIGMKSLMGVCFELEALPQDAEAFQLADEPLFEEKYIEYINF